MPDILTWYPQLKSAHMTLVLCSGGLFALRGALVLGGWNAAMARPWRMLSYAIDSLLLAAGLTLWALLSINPLHASWLGVKLLLLVLYIVLGSLALKRARSRGLRRASYGMALLVYVFMVSVAVAHHPLGLWHLWWPTAT